jgi:hypothetical protein
VVRPVKERPHLLAFDEHRVRANYIIHAGLPVTLVF